MDVAEIVAVRVVVSPSDRETDGIHCNLSSACAHDFGAIRSYLATAAKHGIGFLYASPNWSRAAWLPITA